MHDSSAATFAATCHIKKSLNFVLKKNVDIVRKKLDLKEVANGCVTGIAISFYLQLILIRCNDILVISKIGDFFYFLLVVLPFCFEIGYPVLC
jgi:hypothetical protein